MCISGTFILGKFFRIHSNGLFGCLNVSMRQLHGVDRNVEIFLTPLIQFRVLAKLPKLLRVGPAARLVEAIYTTKL